MNPADLIWEAKESAAKYPGDRFTLTGGQILQLLAHEREQLAKLAETVEPGAPSHVWNCCRREVAAAIRAGGAK